LFSTKVEKHQPVLVFRGRPEVLWLTMTPNPGTASMSGSTAAVARLSCFCMVWAVE